MKKFLMVAAALACAVASNAQAQTFPDKPVRVILPFPTGTGPDTVMRMMGVRLAKLWGQQVVVENRPGGNGWISMDAAKRAPADGHTLMQVDASQMAAHPHLFKKMPVDPAKDYDPVAPLYRTYYYVTVAADAKWKTVGELLADAKAKPGAITYGSSGMGGNLHLGGAMMEKATGTKMHHVPYKETTQIYMAIASGDIQWAVGTASTTQPMVKARRVGFFGLSVSWPDRKGSPQPWQRGAPPLLETFDLLAVLQRQANLVEALYEQAFRKRVDLEPVALPVGSDDDLAGQVDRHLRAWRAL